MSLIMVSKLAGEKILQKKMVEFLQTASAVTVLRLHQGQNLLYEAMLNTRVNATLLTYKNMIKMKKQCAKILEVLMRNF